MTKSLRAVVYARISYDRAGEGLGVARQEQECRELCEREGWRVVEVLSDNDISAYSGKRRPGYERLLDLIRRSEVDVVVAWNTDRLHRRLVELIAYTEACAPRSVTTHTVRTGPIDLSTPSGILVAQQLGAVAEYESRLRSKRVKSATDQRALAGKVHGGPRPFGWDQDGVTPRESEQRELRDAATEILRGGSLQGIARDWRAREILTTRGKSWKGTLVREVLLRPRNAGLRVHRGVIVGPAVWHPVISPERWHALRQMLTAPGRRTSEHSGATPRNFGSHRYLCGVCGSVMKAGRTGVYRCGGYVDSDAKRHVSIDKQAADDYVQRKLVAGMVEQGFGPAPEHPTVSDTASSADKRQSIVDAQTALATELAAGRIPAAAYSAANTQLAERLAELDAEDAQTVVSRVVDARLDGFDRDPWGTWEALPMEVRRELLDMFVTVTVHPAPPTNYRYGQNVADRLEFAWKFGNLNPA